MHTYMKSEDGGYWIGQWLPNLEGITQFSRMFKVPSLKQALVAVNCLNGGQRISPDALHIIEET